MWIQGKIITEEAHGPPGSPEGDPLLASWSALGRLAQDENSESMNTFS